VLWVQAFCGILRTIILLFLFILYNIWSFSLVWSCAFQYQKQPYSAILRAQVCVGIFDSFDGWCVSTLFMQYFYMCIPQILCFVSEVIIIAWDIWFPCLLLTLHFRSTWNLVIWKLHVVFLHNYFPVNQTYMYIYANELTPGHANFKWRQWTLKCRKNVIICYIIYNIFWTIFCDVSFYVSFC